MDSILQTISSYQEQWVKVKKEGDKYHLFQKEATPKEKPSDEPDNEDGQKIPDSIFHVTSQKILQWCKCKGSMSTTTMSPHQKFSHSCQHNNNKARKWSLWRPTIWLGWCGPLISSRSSQPDCVSVGDAGSWLCVTHTDFLAISPYPHWTNHQRVKWGASWSTSYLGGFFTLCWVEYINGNMQKLQLLQVLFKQSHQRNQRPVPLQQLYDGAPIWSNNVL